jgi:uncharacterized membrane protein
MQPEALKELSDEALIAEARKIKSNRWMYAFLVGAFVGIVIYSAVKNENHARSINKEMQSRNLQR